jgi:pre-mRNA-splicing factor ATP-dependent RNA helicase DHX38/PRP16
LLIKAAWEKLMNAIRENKIVIVAGQARSGEMTKLVKDLFDEGYTTDKLIIGCIQPKRVAAVSAAKRTAEKMKKDLGQEVGYSTRFEDVSSEKTIIKYMTDVVLLRESLNDPDLDKYSVIIVDEAHERSLHRDVLLGMLRIAASNRKYLKIIIISPTECVKRFSDFFISAPVVEISEGTFPVNTFFLKDLEEDYVDAAVRQAISIHLQECEGDILIFMTGKEDVEKTYSLIAEKLEKMEGAPKMQILPIYSALPSDAQANIFDVRGERKCIVATDIAETSLTLDRVKFVIDIGFCKLKVYNPKIGMDVLLETPISQASANQRSGLAGRTGPGV